MNRPKAVAFDLGKVLVDFDYGLAAERLARGSNLSAAAIRPQIEGSPAHVAFETGRIGAEEFHVQVRKATGYGGGFEEFQSAFADIFSPIDVMIGLHQRFLELGCPTYIFSNTNPIAVDHIRARFPFFSHFQGYVYSYEYQAMKPDPKLYEVVERVTGCAGEDILYLDDREENAVSGRQRGWRVIHHEHPGTTLDQCRAWGFLC